MKITKYEHSCIVVEEGGQKLVIDPGVYSTSLTNLANISCVFITHIHDDHFDKDKIKQIASQNPGVKIFAPMQVATELTELPVSIVKGGSAQSIGSLGLSFIGGKHELFEQFENIGVVVNGVFCYPGDSYAKPGQSIQVLALPASAPWLRVPDTVRYMQECAPKIVFPVHNALLSDIGESIHYRIISSGAHQIGADWRVLKPGESLG